MIPEYYENPTYCTTVELQSKTVACGKSTMIYKAQKQLFYYHRT